MKCDNCKTEPESLIRFGELCSHMICSDCNEKAWDSSDDEVIAPIAICPVCQERAIKT
jgi:hypothetical protein